MRSLYRNWCQGSYITTDAAFNRNHGEIVYLDAATHRVTVDGEVTTPLNLSIASLKNEFEQHEVICALQCAGNRRDTMRRRWKDLRGLNWCDGAIMNCRWRGPRLRDVLIKAGVSPDADTSGLHAVFSCYQTLCEDDDHFGGSIELWRAMSVDAEVILALQVRTMP
ncbi:hypothetical protein KEM55_007797 [Ascosphaera atra]|nr:hypothetical protein KEM55_007797 [Ascosphaera atra]